MKDLLGRLRILGSEVVMGSLIAILTVFTAVVGFQGSIVDGDQAKANVDGQRLLTDANAEYLSVNQMLVYDYTMYDGWYTADTTDKEEYYQGSFSEELQSSIDANADDPFSDAYYDAMYADVNGMFDEADLKFELAEKLDNRGDALQMVLMTMAVALALSAWASLVSDQSALRVTFALLSILLFAYSLITYLTIPTVAV